MRRLLIRPATTRVNWTIAERTEWIAQLNQVLPEEWGCRLDECSAFGEPWMFIITEDEYFDQLCELLKCAGFRTNDAHEQMSTPEKRQRDAAKERDNEPNASNRGDSAHTGGQDCDPK